MKTRLKKLLEQKNERKAAILEQVSVSTDVVELKSLDKELEGLNSEITVFEGIINEPVAERTAAVNGNVPAIVAASVASTELRTVELDDMEYRKAFQQLVTRGTPIDAEFRLAQATLTTDIGTAIPIVVINKIIEKLEAIGMVLPLITRTSFPYGIIIPTANIKPIATWVAEGTAPDSQKKTTGSITFTNFKLRCDIEISMEAATMAVSAFESIFIGQVSKAMVKALELAILSTADGTTSPKGILYETPVLGQALTYNALTYETLIEAESALPIEYEDNAMWCMNKKTFLAFVGMKDSAGQPIARTNYGITGKPDRTLLGRSVLLVGGNYLESFGPNLLVGHVFAFIFNFSDYAMNTIYDLGIQRRQHWETDNFQTKAILSVDGKVVDKNSLVTLAKSL